MTAKVLLKRTNIKDKDVHGPVILRDLPGYLLRTAAKTGPTTLLHFFYCKKSDADALIPKFYTNWVGIKFALTIKEFGNVAVKEAVAQLQQIANNGPLGNQFAGLAGDNLDFQPMFRRTLPEAYYGLAIEMDVATAQAHSGQAASLSGGEYPIDPKFRNTLQIALPGPITLVDYGELALNYNNETPALYAKASDGSMIKWEGNRPPIRLATAAETTTGTDNTSAVHPAGLKVELDKKAPLASPTFTGTPAAPTAAANTNTTQIATTAFVQRDFLHKNIALLAALP